MSLQALFAGLFDDAAMFPPANSELPAAVLGHARHRLSWYGDMVGPFVCHAGRLPALDEQVRALGIAPVDVAVVVPEGPDALDGCLACVSRCDRLRMCTVEVPLGGRRLTDAVRVLDPLLARQITGYVEIPIGRVTEQQVHQLAAAGLRLKLRTGGTTIDAFHTEAELARPIVMCAAERLAFKCTAGLHDAVRHRDPQTLFEHHGFLNIGLAARVAAATGSVAAVTGTLAEQDRAVIAERTRELRPGDVDAVRALFASFGTCSITEPLDELAAMGLVSPI